MEWDQDYDAEEKEKQLLHGILLLRCDFEFRLPPEVDDTRATLKDQDPFRVTMLETMLPHS